MTWPADDVSTTAMDAGTDTPPRAEFKSWADKFNQMRNHVTAFMQGLLTSASAADVRGALDVPTRTGGNASGTWGISVAGTAGNISGVAAIANGGTGQSNAAAAFAALKQPASASATGVVELATNAEAQASADTTRAVTPANLGATLLGMGQSWQNVARSLGVSYTNSTGRAIAIAVSSTIASGNTLSLTVSGVTVAQQNISGGASGIVSIFSIIPPGAPYQANGGTLNAWTELR